MVRFGDNDFSLVIYNQVGSQNGFDYEFDLIINGKSLCSQIANGVLVNCICNVLLIRRWFIENLSSICNEKEFPLSLNATSALDFYNKSGDYDFEDDVQFDTWFTKRQDWYFRHSWLCADSGSYLADVLFFNKSNQIEVTWDNTELYEDIKFLNPIGYELIEIDKFRLVIDEFINSYFFQ